MNIYCDEVDLNSLAEDQIANATARRDASRTSLRKYTIQDDEAPATKVEIAKEYVLKAKTDGILLIKALRKDSISLEQYNELIGDVAGLARGGANKNVNKRIKNSRYKKSKRR